MTHASRQRRRLPFLHRNWTAGITAYQAWHSLDKPRYSHGVCFEPSEDREDGLHARASKRRCLGEAAVGVESFKHRECLSLWLPEYPIGRSNGMRVRVFNILHQDTPRIRFNSVANLPPSDISTFSMRCKITIMSEKCGIPLLLYCDAHIGTVQASKSTQSHLGLARLHLEPFTIPLEKIAMLHEETGMFGLADKYKMRIEVESAGNDTWPPLDLVAFTGAVTHSHQHAYHSHNKHRPKRTDDCILYAESNDIFGRPRMRIPLWLRESPRHDPVRTTFMMDMDIQWSTGFLEHPRKPPEKGVLPTIVAFHPDEPCPDPALNALHGFTNGLVQGRYWDAQKSANSLTNGANDHMNGHVNGHVNGHLNGKFHSANGHINGNGTRTSNGVDSALDDDEDDAEGELTPSRSLRSRRGQPDYNLRNITNKAHGKEPRAARKRHARPFDDESIYSGNIFDGNKVYDDDSRNSKVTYFLPPERMTVNGFVCCICMAANPNMNQLRVHLLSHLHYLFKYEPHLGVNGDHIVRMTHCPDESVNTFQPPAIYQLGRPTKRLDLNKFLAGDDSWVTSRYGPQNDEKGLASFAYVPRAKSKSKQISLPARSKLVVPHIKQQIYDPLSKVLLEPGTRIRPTVVDDSWLIHKHREVVQDYSDLSSTEKEFIQEWDKFIISRHISSDAYIPRALREFVEEKDVWLVADQSRAIEFGKHMAVMIARDLLSDEDIQDITRCLSGVWKRARKHPELATAADANAVPKTGPHRSKGGCTTCGLPVLGPLMLVCANKRCPRRLYHSSCVRSEAKISVDQPKWFCNTCSNLAKSAT